MLSFTFPWLSLVLFPVLLFSFTFPSLPFTLHYLYLFSLLFLCFPLLFDYFPSFSLLFAWLLHGCCSFTKSYIPILRKEEDFSVASHLSQSALHRLLIPFAWIGSTSRARSCNDTDKESVCRSGSPVSCAREGYWNRQRQQLLIHTSSYSQFALLRPYFSTMIEQNCKIHFNQRY